MRHPSSGSCGRRSYLGGWRKKGCRHFNFPGTKLPCSSRCAGMYSVPTGAPENWAKKTKLPITKANAAIESHASRLAGHALTSSTPARVTYRKMPYSTNGVRKSAISVRPMRIMSLPPNLLPQIAQDSRGHAPDITLPEGDRIIVPRHALPFARMPLHVSRIHHVGEWHFEDFVDLRYVESQLEARLHTRDQGNDPVSKGRHVEIEIADRLDMRPLEADLLFCFAQCGVHRTRVVFIDLPTRKRHLPRMVGKVLRALRQQHGRLRMIDNADQHRSWPDRPHRGDLLHYRIGIMIPAAGNDVWIGETGRNLEGESRACAPKKLLGRET